MLNVIFTRMEAQAAVQAQADQAKEAERIKEVAAGVERCKEAAAEEEAEQAKDAASLSEKDEVSKKACIPKHLLPNANRPVYRMIAKLPPSLFQVTILTELLI